MNRIYLPFVFALTNLLVSTTTAQLPEYDSPIIYGRTGVTSFNMPNGSSLSSPTISIDDQGDVALDVNFVGNTGNAGVFYGTQQANMVTAAIVYNASDIITGDPTLNGQQQTVFTVGLDSDLFLYDAKLQTTTPLNFPLGVSGSSGLTLDADQQIGGRLRFGFDGDVYGTFPVQDSGFPSLQVYAADSDADASSPYSFLYTPDMSRGAVPNPRRIAAKVSTTAGFDFEEIRIFEADGTSTLIAVETEIDPMSPFSEFVTNSVTISDDGSKVAFQAIDTQGVSGIYCYDDNTQAITRVGSESDEIVATIDIFSPDVNNAGTVVFRGDDSLGLSSVFVGDGSTLIRLGGEGDSVLTDLGKRQLGRRDQNFSQSGAPRINNHGDIGWIFQYFDPTNPNSVADGSLIMLSPAADCLPGDVNQDGSVNLLDVAPLVDAIANSTFSCESDVNQDSSVDLLDVAPFVELLTGG